MRIHQFFYGLTPSFVRYPSDRLYLPLQKRTARILSARYFSGFVRLLAGCPLPLTHSLSRHKRNTTHTIFFAASPCLHRGTHSILSGCLLLCVLFQPLFASFLQIHNSSDKSSRDCLATLELLVRVREHVRLLAPVQSCCRLLKILCRID